MANIKTVKGIKYQVIIINYASGNQQPFIYLFCKGTNRLLYSLLEYIQFRVLEGGLAAATVLVSFGVLIGKINPLQLLVMGFIETILFVINCYIGYTVLGAVDIGKWGKRHNYFQKIYQSLDLRKFISYLDIMNGN